MGYLRTDERGFAPRALVVHVRPAAAALALRGRRLASSRRVLDARVGLVGRRGRLRPRRARAGGRRGARARARGCAPGCARPGRPLGRPGRSGAVTRCLLRVVERARGRDVEARLDPRGGHVRVLAARAGRAAGAHDDLVERDAPGARLTAADRASSHVRVASMTCANLALNLTRTAAEHPDDDRRQARRRRVQLRPARQRAARASRRCCKSKGVGPGDRVGIMLPNVPYFPAVYYGDAARGRRRRADERAAQGARGRVLPARTRGRSCCFAWHGFMEAAEAGRRGGRRRRGRPGQARRDRGR